MPLPQACITEVLLFPNDILSLNASAMLSCVFRATKQIPRLIVSASVSKHTRATTFIFLDACRLNIWALVNSWNSPCAWWTYMYLVVYLDFFPWSAEFVFLSVNEIQKLDRSLEWARSWDALDEQGPYMGVLPWLTGCGAPELGWLAPNWLSGIHFLHAWENSCIILKLLFFFLRKPT